MSITLTNDAIDSTSGKIILEESGHQIELRDGKLIITDKFVSLGTYVLPKNTVIPIAYILAKKTSGTSTVFNYNVSTGTLTKSDSNGTVQLLTTDYANSGLTTILADSSVTKTYTLSVCESNVSSNSSTETTEVNYYKTNKAFNKNAYNMSLKAPTLVCNNQAVPYTSNTNLTVQQSGNTFTFTSKVASYLYICLLVTLS